MARIPGFRNMVTNTYQTRKRWIRACKSRLADTAENRAPILPFSAHSATMRDLPVQLERIFSTTQHGNLESYFVDHQRFLSSSYIKTRLKGVFLISVNPLRRLLRSSMNLLADDREPPHVYIGSNISESSPVPFGSSRSSSPIPKVSPIRLPLPPSPPHPPLPDDAGGRAAGRCARGGRRWTQQ